MGWFRRALRRSNLQHPPMDPDEVEVPIVDWNIGPGSGPGSKWELLLVFGILVVLVLATVFLLGPLAPSCGTPIEPGMMSEPE